MQSFAFYIRTTIQFWLNFKLNHYSMKVCIAFCLLFSSMNVIAQQKDETELIGLTRELSATVFGSKDSILLDKLFAKQVTYGHSKGKVENRSEALRGIINNKSTYTDTALTNIQVIITNKTAVVRHLFKAKEIKADGTTGQLNFTMMLVWIKQNKHWRLMARQAVALP